MGRSWRKRKLLLMRNVVPVLSWRETARTDLLAIVGYMLMTILTPLKR